MATPNLRFPKAEKLKSRKQIDLLFKEGKSFFASPIKCYYVLRGLENASESTLSKSANEAGEIVATPQFPLVGVSVPKKFFKKATDRNHIKRLMRESYRHHKPALLSKIEQKPISLVVFMVFTDRAIPSYELVEEKIKYCLRRLGRILEEVV